MSGSNSETEVILTEKLFQSLFSLVKDPAYIVDHNYKIIFANKAAIYDFRSSGFVGLNLFDVFPNTTQEESRVAQVMKSGKAIKGARESFITGVGQRAESLTHTYPIKKNGKTVAVFQLAEIITGLSNLSDQVMRSSNVGHGSGRKSKGSYYTIDSIIGQSDCIKELREKICQAAESDSNLMIYGETGTGKEMVAQAVYSLYTKTHRHSGPFVAQNCAAIPESLLESMLFGTVKGAYTGAENRAGLFELADGGVMFLDEMNSLPLTLQAKILRVIDEGYVRRLGDHKEQQFNFRLFSAFNVDPGFLLRNGDFRRDLFYRLNVLYIEIPPLRRRPEDIPLLVHDFINEYNQRGGKQIESLDRESLEILKRHPWLGNVRELRNYLERAFNQTADPVINLRRLNLMDITHQNNSYYQAPAISGDDRIRFKDAVAEAEIGIIKSALRRSEGNVSQAARSLDIPQQTLDGKIAKYNLRPFIHELKDDIF